MGARIFIPAPDEHETQARRMYRAMEGDGCKTVCLGGMSENTFVDVSRSGWFIMGENAGCLLGYLLLRQFEARSARLHFCILRAARADGLDYARRAFAIAFDSGRLDSIYGIFPATYRHVTPLARSLGGAWMGEIPGAAWDNIRNRPVPGVVWLFTPADSGRMRTHTQGQE